MTAQRFPWLRLYTDTKDNAKIRSMTLPQRAVYYGLLQEARKATPGGTISSDDLASLALEVSDGDEDLLSSTIEHLLKFKSLEQREDGLLGFTNWDKHQPRSPSAEPEATAERQRKSREASRPVTTCHEDVTRRHDLSRGCHEDVTDVTRLEGDKEEEIDREEDLSAPYSPPPSTTEDREAEAVAQVPVAMQIAKALHLDTYTGERHRKVARTLFLARSRLPQLLTLARRERAEYSFASATFDQKMGVLERLVRRVTETAPTQPPPRIAPPIPFPERKEEFPSTGEAAWAEVVEFCQDSARKGLGRDGRGTDFLRIAALQFLSADNEAKIIRLAGYLQGTRPFDTMVVNAINSTRGAFGWTPEIEWHHQAAEVMA